jgi:hypothetical protein
MLLRLSALVSEDSRPLSAAVQVSMGMHVFDFGDFDFLLSGDPSAYVGRTPQQHEASSLALSEEAHGIEVHEVHLAQVKRDLWAAVPNLCLQFGEVLRLDAADEADGGGTVPTGMFPDL